MNATEKAAGPVTPQELEGLSLRVAQARSTVAILGLAADAKPDLQNALGLLELWLDSCAEDLSDLHRRHENRQASAPAAQETQPCRS